MNKKENESINSDEENLNSDFSESEEFSNEVDDSEDLKKLESENDSLKKEVKEMNEKYLRLAAEYKNYQERSKREKLEIRKDSLVDAVSSVLPIIDDIERTLPSFFDAGEKYEKGVKMILKRVSDSLQGLGVESFGEKGEEFDPSVHNASSKIESDNDKVTISEVYQKGYKVHGKLIRPAMVQVIG